MDKYRVLKQYFGYESFRPGQERIIDSILSGRDAFGIMPTGGGKSLCYQIPALILPGVTFVVSPLISLMQDQVMQLKDSGVSAAYVNSTLTIDQLNAVYRNLYNGMYKLVYVAPERLETEEFRNAASYLDISLFAVDEAHCISQWGQDFRPSYLRIPEFLDALRKRPVVSAFTATATRRVMNDIEGLLGLCSPEKVVTSFDRPNLSFDVIKPRNKNKALEQLVLERSGKSGIIYCSTRSNVESVCERLKNAGIAATRYHAGLEDAERKTNQEEFLYDTKPLMVATNAFGMGINKSNVNYVIHYNMPKSLEEYYQEAGRAGRDGENAECILLYNASDIITAKLLVGSGMRLQENELWEKFPMDMERLKCMTDYCETTECFRGKLLDYFGEEHSDNCGNCGNCNGEYEKRDVTLQAQKILSCILRINKKLGYNLGKSSVVESLLGKDTVRTRKYSLSKIKTFGAMKDDSKEDVEHIIDGLCRLGYIRLNTTYKTLELTPLCNSVLFDGEGVVLPFKKKAAAELIGEDKKKKKKNADGSEEYRSDPELFDVLRKLRMKIASEENHPPFVVFQDSTLRDMANKKPTDEKELLEVSGVGESKAKKYGKAFLAAIREYLNVEPIKTDSEKSDHHASVSSEPTVKAEKKATLDKSSVQKDEKSGFEALLREARIVLSEHPGKSLEGIPIRVTVILTSNGSLYSAHSAEKGVKMSSDEKKTLSLISREDDTRILRMVTMWQDGSVFGTSPELLRRLFELEHANRDAKILVAVNPRTKYNGVYESENYDILKLKDLI